MNAPVGELFGYLTVMGLGESRTRIQRGHNRNGTVRSDRLIEETKWRCRCFCGRTVDVWPANLRAGRSRSCGCATPRPRARRNPMRCALDGCDRPYYGVGLCQPHYDQKRYQDRKANK